MPTRARTQQPTLTAESVSEAMTNLVIEALRFIPQARVTDSARDWLAHAAMSLDDPPDARRLADAVGLASDLALFMPSASGMTAIDRLARHRKAADQAEAAAIGALRQARFRVMHVDARESECVVRLRDLASSEILRVVDKHLPPPCIGVSLVGRTAPLGDDRHALIGATTPLDDAGLSVALGFVRPNGRGLVNPQRCAEVVYRYVVRHGGPEIPGLNRPPEDAEDELSFGPEGNELDELAHSWAKPGADTASAEVVQRIRDMTSLDNLLNALGYSVRAREDRRGPLADAYARIAAIQIETIQLRTANGMSGLSLAAVADALFHEITEHGMPAAARFLFEDLQRRCRTAAPGGTGSGDLDRLISRIQALRAKTVEQGCTEQEALAAAEKVAELLDRYGLSLSAIELGRETCQGIGIDTGRRRLGPIDDCVPSIAIFFDCRAWTEKARSAAIRHVFFGFRADVEAARYLYELVELAFSTEAALFTRGEFYAELDSGERRSATNSFRIGLGRAIAAKLRSLREARETALRSSGRDLVPMKAATVDDELAKLGLHFRAQDRPSSRYVMTDAYEAGQAAGQRFEYRPGLAAAD